MKLIVGLGNPEEHYGNTRHNVGYTVIDKLKNLKTEKLKNIIFTKTNVFMNESGKAVKKLIDHYALPINHLYIVHDDLDIPLGQFKIQWARGPKDHKGIQSVEEALGTDQFWRVRVGVEHRANGVGQRVSGEEYVLQEFTKEEREVIDRVALGVAQAILNHARQN